MLVAASVVFLYYSIWTLLMVRLLPALLHILTQKDDLSDPPHAKTALRRLGSPPPELLPPACLGHPHTRHPYPPWMRRCRIFLERCHDQEQQEEGRKGKGRRRQEEGVKPKSEGDETMIRLSLEK